MANLFLDIVQALSPLAIIPIAYWFNLRLKERDDYKKSIEQRELILVSFNDIMQMFDTILEFSQNIIENDVENPIRRFLHLWNEQYSKQVTFELRLRKTLKLTEDDIDLLEEFDASFNMTALQTLFLPLFTKTEEELPDNATNELARLLTISVNNIKKMRRELKDILLNRALR